MGNIECCRQKSNYDLIESKEEMYIRETLDNFSDNMVKNEKLNKLMQKYFSIYLLDIEGPPLDWISEDSYNSFIIRIFEKNGKSQIREEKLKFIKLDYNKVRNISLIYLIFEISIFVSI